MANIIKRVWNQNKMVLIEDLKGMAFQAEAEGHTFEISGIDDDGNPVTFSGTPSGVFLRPDNTDVALTCSISGGKIYATFPATCYSVPGRFGLTIYITTDGATTAVYAAIGTVALTTSGTIAPPATDDVVDLINDIATAVASIPASYSSLLADIAPTYSSSALYSVGQYAWYDGDLKRCIVPITVAETYTAAHWTSAVLGNDVADLKSALNSNNASTDPIYGYKRTASKTSVANSYTNLDCEFKAGVLYRVKFTTDVAAPTTIQLSTSNLDTYVDQNVGILPSGNTETMFTFIPTAHAWNLRVKYYGTTIITYTAEVEEQIVTDMAQKTVNIGTSIGEICSKENKDGWEQGTLTAAECSNYSSNTRIRNKTKYGISNGVCSITCDSGYYLRIYAWDGNTYAGVLKTNGRFEASSGNLADVTEFNCSEWPEYTFMIVMSITGDSEIVPSAGEHCYHHMATDKTLTQENKSADAKKTGEAITVTRNNQFHAEEQIGIKTYYFEADGYSIYTANASITVPFTPVKRVSELYSYLIIPCAEGANFHVKAKADNDYLPWCFCTSDGTKLGIASSYSADDDLIAPKNTEYLIVNANRQHDFYVIKGKTDYLRRVNTLDTILKGNFEKGSWATSTGYYKNTGENWKARSYDYIVYNEDIELIALSGYKFYVQILDSNMGLVNNFGDYYACIPANTKFVITIAQDPEDTSVTANPHEYSHGVSVIKRRFETYGQNWAAFLKDKSRVVAHKGWIGDTSTYPENSVKAFNKAAELGAWGIETDIRETIDGYFVLIHDDDVSKWTTGEGYISEMTLAEVEELRLKTGDGTDRIPTLDQYLNICKLYQLVPVMEIKAVQNSIESIGRIYQAVKEHGLTHISAYVANSKDHVKYIRKYDQFSPILLMSGPSGFSTDFDFRMAYILCMGNMIIGPSGLSTFEEIVEKVHIAHMNNLIFMESLSTKSDQITHVKEANVDFFNSDYNMNLFTE